MTHQEARELIDKYHAKAIELYEGDDTVKISPIKNVQMTSDGAFVEAMVWVPKEYLDETN